MSARVTNVHAKPLLLMKVLKFVVETRARAIVIGDWITLPRIWTRILRGYELGRIRLLRRDVSTNFSKIGDFKAHFTPRDCPYDQLFHAEAEKRHAVPLIPPKY